MLARRADSSDPLSSGFEGEGRRPLETEDRGGEPSAAEVEEEAEAAGA